MAVSCTAPYSFKRLSSLSSRAFSNRSMTFVFCVMTSVHRSTIGSSTLRCSSSSRSIRLPIRVSRFHPCQSRNTTTKTSGPYCLSNGKISVNVTSAKSIAVPPCEKRKATRPDFSGRVDSCLDAQRQNSVRGPRTRLALENHGEVGVQHRDTREDVQVDHGAAVGDAVLHRNSHGDVVVDTDMAQHAHRVVGNGQGPC